MLEVGFDIRPLQTAHRFRGIGRYTAELYSALSEGEGDINLRFLGLAGAPEPSLPDGASFTGVKLPDDHDRYRSVIFDLIQTPRAVRAMDVAVVHYNMQVVPPWSPKRFVLTVHDCISAVFPGRSLLLREKVFFNIQAAAARRAAAVITVSNSSARDIVRYMGVPPDKIRVIYEACSSQYKPDARCGGLNERVNLPDEYLLYVGATDYRKNLSGLLEIYGRYCEQSRAPLPLVLTGNPEYYRNVRFTWPEGTHGGIVGGEVAYTGFLSEEMMPALYCGARVFLFPSLYEGFGLPPLEAMACGTPVIAYDNSSVSEVVGRWGSLVPTGEAGAFVAEMIRITENDRLRSELSDAGLERAGHFSWSKAAGETAEVYREAARCA
ncbi:MAG: glycosyltransferase family 4 protein [Candidatus Coatesbacteria bacterium]|nr:MAG: glycosyltransferase family 4 protein [Candidatus Coatesbacteria bacterium]